MRKRPAIVVGILLVLATQTSLAQTGRVFDSPLQGNHSENGDVWKLESRSQDIWGRADAFRFVYVELVGDGTLTARVASLADTDPWAKAGLMVRGGLEPASKNVAMVLTAGNGWHFQWRAQDGAESLAVPPTGATDTAPGWVRVSRKGDVVVGYRSSNGVDWSEHGRATLNLGSTVYVGLCHTSHNAYVSGSAEFDNTSTSAGVGFHVGAVGVTVGPQSNHELRNGVYTISDSSFDIAGTRDSFYYAYSPMSGDGEIVARVMSMSDTWPWAKAGVMIRETLDEDSRHAMMIVTSEDRTAFQHRPATGDQTYSASSDPSAISKPHWVRLVRQGNTFTGYHSTDGVNWVQQDNTNLNGATLAQNPATIHMDKDVYVGLCLTSHNPYSFSTAEFDNVRRPSAAAPPNMLGDFYVLQVTPSFGAEVPTDALLSVVCTNPVDINSVALSQNVRLQILPGGDNVALAVESVPNSRTLLLEPQSPLRINATYRLSIADGPAALKDVAGQTIGFPFTSEFSVSDKRAPDQFESTHYLKTLAMTRWEVFPLLGPTAGGRAGFATVIPATRKFLLSVTDVVTPGRGSSVAIRRVYRNNSQAATGIFGNNWHFNYDRHFIVVPDENGDGFYELRFRSSDGRLFTYTSNGSSDLASYTSPPGFYDTLKTSTNPVSGSGPELLAQRTKFGAEALYEFHSSGNTSTENPSSLPVGATGYLVALRDRNRNWISVMRHPSNHPALANAVAEIVDDLDRRTSFNYSPISGRLESIVQFNGRTWTYAIDADNNLVSVELPATDFYDESGVLRQNARKQHRYTYQRSVGNVYNLSSMEDGRGNVSLEVSYDSQNDVTQVKYGVRSASGTTLYSYSSDQALGTSTATQIDRNGNTLLIEHENKNTPPMWNIERATIYTRGEHPTLPFPEPFSYTTNFVHDSDSELIEAPNTNIQRWIRDTKGNIIQYIFKAATSEELFHNGPEFKREDDIVWEFAYDEDFSFPIRVTEPRGNHFEFVGTSPSVVSNIESVLAQTPRTFRNIDAEKRNAYTTFLYYDHERIGGPSGRLAEDAAALGYMVDLVRDFPRSFGRVSGGKYNDALSSVFADNDGDGFADRGGNLYAIRGPRPRVVDPNSGDYQSLRQIIETNMAYNQYGQMFLRIEPDGDVGRFEWYMGPFDLSANPNRGYLKKVVVASKYTGNDIDTSTGIPVSGPTGSGFEIVTNFTYDLVGNVFSVTDPRENKTHFTVDRLNLLRKVTGPAPFNYEMTLGHDGNNNIAVVSMQNAVPMDLNNDGIQNVGEQTDDTSHPIFEHRFQYNTANSLIRRNLDAFGSVPDRLVTEFGYDAKQLLTSVREPEGNVHRWTYDVRDLIRSETIGASNPLESQTTLFDYDHNRNLIQVIDDDGNSNPHVVRAFDVFDRVVKTIDEVGNHVEFVYDVASLVRQRIVTGQFFGDSVEPPTSPLEHILTEYDEARRPFQYTRELFGAIDTLDNLGLARLMPPIDLGPKRVNGGELVNSVITYDQEGKPLVSRDDNSHESRFFYDSADRLTQIMDSLGSSRSFTHDLASNVIRITSEDLIDDGSLAETYYSEYFFDALNRQMAAVSHLGNTTRILYDSRGNVVQVSDAMGVLGTEDISSLPTAGEHGMFPQFTTSNPSADPIINGRGNTVRFIYDGVSRQLSIIRDLRQDGTGDTTAVSQIVTETSWDGNSRVARRADPQGNFTEYSYDHQNRLTHTLYADATEHTSVWNRVNTVAFEIDPRGVIKDYRYDLAERRTALEIMNLPHGEGQTTFASWLWDGLYRNTQAEDNDSICEKRYDSLSRVVEDIQYASTGRPRQGPTESLDGEVLGITQRVFDGVGNLVGQIYPSGYALLRNYDKVDRLKGVGDSIATIATFRHIGMGRRRVSRTYPTPMIKLLCEYDGNRRIVRHDHIRTDNSQRIRGFTYAWDRANNRRFERDLLRNTNPGESRGPGTFFDYDSAYRLIHADEEVSSAHLSTIPNNFSRVTRPPIIPSLANEYMLDPAGNRIQTTLAGALKNYSLQSGSPTFDQSMNQYSEIGSQTRSHDQAGNTTSSDLSRHERFFDCDSQLIQWTETTKDVRYRYDADGRRFLKYDARGSFPATLYFYDGWRCVEETDSQGGLIRRYIHGEGIDEVVRATLPDVTDLDDDSNDTEFVELYYHDNSLGSVVAVTDAIGNVVESYHYTPYGTPTVFDRTSSSAPSSRIGQPFMFTGRRLDFEEQSGLYYYRLRYYDPEAGRFISRDPLGTWGDPFQLGNAQNYCHNNPVNFLDPFGLQEGEGGSRPIPKPNTSNPQTHEQQSIAEYIKTILSSLWASWGNSPVDPKTMHDTIDIVEEQAESLGEKEKMAESLREYRRAMGEDVSDRENRTTGLPFTDWFMRSFVDRRYGNQPSDDGEASDPLTSQTDDQEIESEEPYIITRSFREDLKEEMDSYEPKNPQQVDELAGKLRELDSLYNRWLEKVRRTYEPDTREYRIWKHDLNERRKKRRLQYRDEYGSDIYLDAESVYLDELARAERSRRASAEATKRKHFGE